MEGPLGGLSLFRGALPVDGSLQVATRYRCSLEIERPISDLHPDSPTKAAPRSRRAAGKHPSAPSAFLSSFEIEECRASSSSRWRSPRDEGIGMELKMDLQLLSLMPPPRTKDDAISG